MNAYDLSGQLAIDSQHIDKLRNQARHDPQAGLRQAARQFEALFVNMMLKSMRDASPQQGLFDNEQSRFYTQMLDQQLAQNLAGQGIGLADLIVQQLDQVMDAADQPDTAIDGATSLLASIAGGRQDDPVPLVTLAQDHFKDLPSQLWHNPAQSIARPTFSTASPASLAAPFDSNTSNQATAAHPAVSQPHAFVSEMLPHARRVARETGIPERFMIAQAALESGWGKRQIQHADGRPSFNLFGIKAGKNWQGGVVETVTTEYIDGRPQKIKEAFRAYASYEEAFRDYAHLLQTQPRYAGVLKSRSATAFAWGLQQAGYATDPNYADKLIKIIQNDALGI
ncbi:flagellar assembly peptidoglycan hydrolase FlgJ [Nitrosomonas sp. ANs5]|uniref:flagellar assembly peptidoglycan hydrolase FlgJ n=1 Tax=Nitrosomonas sp. ANs5 TaxID=3423941 RepID=UPI003D35844D